MLTEIRALAIALTVAMFAAPLLAAFVIREFMDEGFLASFWVPILIGYAFYVAARKASWRVDELNERRLRERESVRLEPH